MANEFKKASAELQEVIEDKKFTTNPVVQKRLMKRIAAFSEAGGKEMKRLEREAEGLMDSMNELQGIHQELLDERNAMAAFLIEKGLTAEFEDYMNKKG